MYSEKWCKSSDGMAFCLVPNAVSSSIPVEEISPSSGYILLCNFGYSFGGEKYTSFFSFKELDLIELEK